MVRHNNISPLFKAIDPTALFISITLNNFFNVILNSLKKKEKNHQIEAFKKES